MPDCLGHTGRMQVDLARGTVTVLPALTSEEIDELNEGGKGYNPATIADLEAAKAYLGYVAHVCSSLLHNEVLAAAIDYASGQIESAIGIEVRKP